MIPDAELISLMCTVLTKLDVGEFTIKLNHRKILDGIFEVCGVPREKIRAISSAVDKLDKVSCGIALMYCPFTSFFQATLGGCQEGNDRRKGSGELLARLLTDTTVTANPSAKQGLADMELLFTLLDAYQVMNRVSSTCVFCGLS